MMSQRDLLLDLGFLVSHTARVLRRVVDQRAALLGLTRAQWTILAALKREEGRRQIDIAVDLDLEPITVARLIDKLEASGFVERRRDPTDRRAHRLHLLPGAEPILKELQDEAEKILQDAVVGLSCEQVTAMHDSLAILRSNLLARDRANKELEVSDATV
jgi:DNA-binding MarR family transcriptional regulator